MKHCPWQRTLDEGKRYRCALADLHCSARFCEACQDQWPAGRVPRDIRQVPQLASVVLPQTSEGDSDAAEPYPCGCVGIYEPPSKVVAKDVRSPLPKVATRQPESAAFVHAVRSAAERDTHRTGSANLIERLIPVHHKPVGQRVARWSVGVTTAARKLPTLERCLDSLRQAGWNQPRIFAEPDAPIPERYAHLPTTRRDRTFLAWPNFYCGLSELVQTEPDADAYLMIQDDALFGASGIREYLEAALWPAWPIGFVSLYTPRRYAKSEPGWTRYVAARAGRGWVYGAVALVFSAETAALLLATRVAREHTRTPRRNRWVDVTLGRATVEAGLPVWYANPSLVQHVGETTTIWTRGGNHATGLKAAPQFIGDLFS